MSEKRVPLVSIDDLAITLGVSVSTVRSWVRDGEIPRQTYIRVGNTYRFEQEEVISALKDVSETVEEAPSESLADNPEADKQLDPATRYANTLDFLVKHYGRPIKKTDEEKEVLAVDSKKTDDANSSLDQEEPVEAPYIKAAENGDVNAQFFLAYLYADGGFNVEHDEEKSRYWYLKAAEQGHVEAQKICHQINLEYKISDHGYWLNLVGDPNLNVLYELEQIGAGGLKDDKIFILAAIEKDGTIYQFASDQLKQDSDIKEACWSFWYRNIEIVAENHASSLDWEDNLDRDEIDLPPLFLRSDKNFMLQVINKWDSRAAYTLGSSKTRSDEEVIHAALARDPSMWYAIPNAQAADENTLITLFKAFKSLKEIDQLDTFFDFCEEDLIETLEGSNLMNEKEFVMELIALDGCQHAIYNASRSLRADKEVALVAVRNDPSALLYVDPILSDDPDLMAEAAKVDGGQENLEKEY